MCSILQFSLVQGILVKSSALPCIAVLVSALQCIAENCSALMCIAVYYSALQCITVHSSVLQCLAIFIVIKCWNEIKEYNFLVKQQKKYIFLYFLRGVS